MKTLSPGKLFGLAALVCLFGSGTITAQSQPLDIKLATILPRGLGQDAVLKKLEQDWSKASGGTVLLRKAPGAQKDGEAGIVRKLHSGNYQAALLSATGLSEIEPDAAALQMMPLVFQNWEEVDFVREKIGARLEEKLQTKGFVLLFWADMGWVNFFSARKATTPSEFKRMKMFAWAGDNKQVEIMKSLGYQPIALETDNVHSSFATGMIEAAPIPPAFALGMQIPTVASHVLEVNWAPIVGAAIVRKDIWDKIPPGLQKKLRAQCDTAGFDIRAEGRRFHDDALKTLSKGPKTEVHIPRPEERREWQKLALELGPKIRGQLVPAPMYDEVQRLLKEFRAAQSGKAGGLK
jgi:TRAP-type C4-dicarboxylate transport system substrate-binding protein